MKRKIELLAPGGDVDSIKAAILAGADAIYCGLNKLNARNRAANIELEDLYGIIHLAHTHHCKVFLTLNIIIVGSEIPYLVGVLNKLVNTRIDGIIVQDLGLFYLVSRYFKGLAVHASTQMNTHNDGQVRFLSRLAATRVNLSRELNIREIGGVTRVGHELDVMSEVFVHGSYCLSFSGICYMSSVLGGNSGNRGRCSQPCRDRYLTTPAGKNYPLNLKDNSAYFDLGQLSDAGVDALKIEGRIKKSAYVYTVVNCWKKQLQSFSADNSLNPDNSDLYKVFNRDFSNAYLNGDINKQMFIDNPRDNSVAHLSDIHADAGDGKKEADQLSLYREKEEITARVNRKIKDLSIDRVGVVISISGTLDAPLSVSVKTPDTSFKVLSKVNLVTKNKKNIAKGLTRDFLRERFKALNGTGYYLKHLELENLEDHLFISFKEITSIKKRILSILNGSGLNDSGQMTEPIGVPFLKKEKRLTDPPVLWVLISDREDIGECERTGARVFFQLPGCFDNRGDELRNLFLHHKNLIPWFPSVLIGEDYRAAVKFIQQVQPEFMVTDNSGIAYEADEKGIPWIAGPYLNLVNSFGLLCLKENFNCSGAFISNEISKYQIKRIIRPKDFRLYYRIFHPILLLSSRQCLFHQVVGCEKNQIDMTCLRDCEKSTSISDLKNHPLFIVKTKGDYHCIYHRHHFLNTDIVEDLPGIFSGFLVDLRKIKTETNIRVNQSEIIQGFEDFLRARPDSKKRIEKNIHPFTNTQYIKGI